MRVALRQTEENAAKQVESIFAGNGGLQGFQALSDSTSRIQNAVVKQQADFATEILDRAFSSVNAENDYFKELIQNGAVSANDYVKFRWDSLQQGYQNYATAMAQTMSSAEADYENTKDTWKEMSDAAERILLQNQGIEDRVTKYVNDKYDLYEKMAVNTEAANTDSKGGQKRAWDTFWATYDWSDIEL
jgi:hypothetical protein